MWAAPSAYGLERVLANVWSPECERTLTKLENGIETLQMHAFGKSHFPVPGISSK